MTDADAFSFLAGYERAIASGALRADAAQYRAAAALDKLGRELLGDVNPPGFWKFLKPRHKPASGLYLWGDVGRGKSMLMDRFVDFLATTALKQKTRRVHFHGFMLDVHRRLHALRAHRSGDVMQEVIAELANEVRILCLDEMQVSDVTDAMILMRLFSGLMDAGVTVLFTSNRRPRDLYLNGLQREQFLEFVKLLELRIPIIEVGGTMDYRLQQLQAMQRTYWHPLGPAADDFLLESWASLTHGAASQPLRLEVQGRILRVDKQANGIAWLTFDELCVRPLGANDYLTLAKVCHTLLLQNIPQMNGDSRNEAKRFVTLIDTLYDHRVKLVATADAPPDALYPAGDGSFEFHRTASRLHEMQSATYLALPRN